MPAKKKKATRSKTPAKKKPAKKKTPAKKKKPAKRKAPAKKKPAKKKAKSRISDQERYQMIQETAYFLAERDGFRPGHELQYWLQAEDQVVRRLGLK